MNSESKWSKFRRVAVRIFDTVAHAVLITAGFWMFTLFLSRHVGEFISLTAVVALWILLAVCFAALVYLFYSIYDPKDKHRTYIVRPLCTAGTGVLMEVLVFILIMIVGKFTWNIIVVMVVIAIYFLTEFLSIFGHMGKKEKKKEQPKKKKSSVYVRRKR
ncbi:MAG: hypothetical protein LUE29_10385 [Lachnospiraceae bacterium]|nr:hypothetical protein [Lachnospiraceae bacterium]